MIGNLRQKLIKLLNKDIIKVFSLTTIATVVRMLTGLVSVKVVAVIVGPAGIALLGQLNNFTSIIMSGASGGINNGVTKFIAEFKDSKEEVSKLLSNALQITFACSFIVGVSMLFLNQYLSLKIMKSQEYGYVFIVFGLTLFLYSLNMLLTSIINGFKDYKTYIYVNIAGSVFGLVFTVILVFTMGLKGAMISAVTFQSVLFFVTLYIVRKSFWLSKSFFNCKFDVSITKKYFKYTLMTLVTAVTMPLSQILLRGFVISEISLNQAGWWEAMNRISGMYLMVITSSFGVYYLPRLSELRDDKDLNKEIIKAFKVVVPILVLTLTTIYYCRFLIIKILFTKEFSPMSHFFIWQLLGDFFKISSWLVAFLMIAKSMTKLYVFTEIIFALSFVWLGLFLMKANGVVGLTQAYAVNYILYFILMLVLFRKIIFKK